MRSYDYSKAVSSSLGRRRWACDQKNYTLSDGKTTYKLGEGVKISVAGVNLAERRAEFILIDKINLANN